MLKNELELGENLPEYISWFLKSKGLTVVEEKNSGAKIVPIKESKAVYKNRELEQTQELLIGLTQELFNKIEELELQKEIQKEEISENNLENNQEEPREEVKIEFTDISWYSKKLEDDKKNKSRSTN